MWAVLGAIAFGLAAMTVFDIIANYADRAAKLRTTHLLREDLNAEAGRLWRDIEAGRLDDQDAEKRYLEITDRWARATRMAAAEMHDRDNRKAAREANEIVTGRYAR